MLDVGCGKGRWLPLWAQRFPDCRLSGCDISENAIAVARQRCAEADLKVSGKDYVPFNDCSFDFVACIEVIEHVPNADRLLHEINRVLIPGGRLLITAPCANSLSFQWFCAHLRPGGHIRTPYGVRWYADDPSHLNRMTSEELRQQVVEAGFEFHSFYFWQHFFATIDSRIGPLVRQPGRRFARIRRRLRWAGVVLEFLSNVEWSLSKRLPNGSSVIGVFRKRVG